MTTALSLAYRWRGVHEIVGDGDHPLIQYAFSLCDGFSLDTHDEVPWCSAFAQIPAFLLGLPRSRSALARSWIPIGRAVPVEEAHPGFDIVVLKRGTGDQPGASDLTAPGHVGYFAGYDAEGRVLVCGGNQNNKVSIAAFPATRVLAVKRLWGA